jgi:ABC-2 type transport system ATP-binding protein
VKEVEGILSDVVFLKEGRVVLQAGLNELQQRFVQLISPLDLPLPEDLPRPLTETELFGKKIRLFDGVPAAKLSGLGEISTPSLTDIFLNLREENLS